MKSKHNAVKKTVKNKATKGKNIAKSKLASKNKSKVKLKTSSTLIRAKVNMEKALHAQIKKHAVKENTSINKLINAAIQAHLK